MSTAIIRVTRKARTVTYAELIDEQLAAPDADVVEVLGFRSMRLTLRVLGLGGASRPQAGIIMETGMDPKDRDGFVSIGLFDLVGEAPATIQRVFTDLQRYVCWRLIALEGEDASVCFTIDGIVYE